MTALLNATAADLAKLLAHARAIDERLDRASTSLEAAAADPAAATVKVELLEVRVGWGGGRRTPQHRHASRAPPCCACPPAILLLFRSSRLFGRRMRTACSSLHAPRFLHAPPMRICLPHPTSPDSSLPQMKPILPPAKVERD
jgi:hypothetical protein